MKKVISNNTTPSVAAGPKTTGIKLNRYSDQLHSKANNFPATPLLNRIKVATILN